MVEANQEDQSDPIPLGFSTEWEVKPLKQLDSTIEHTKMDRKYCFIWDKTG